MIFDTMETSELVEYDKGTIIKRASIPARDLRVLGPVFAHTPPLFLSQVTMATDEERIESLEAGLGGLQSSVSRMELGIADKFKQLEDVINKLSETVISNKEGSGSSTHNRNGRSQTMQKQP